jgi:hypothetical protein
VRQRLDGKTRARMRETLEQAGWKRLSSSGAETWRHPNNAVLYPLVKAPALERERNAAA